jgi:hypothetical protein
MQNVARAAEVQPPPLVFPITRGIQARLLRASSPAVQ